MNGDRELRGGVPLDQVGQVAVVKAQIIVAGILDFQAGGMLDPRSVLHARVIDLPTGEMTCLPLTLDGAHKLHKGLGELIDALETGPHSADAEA